MVRAFIAIFILSAFLAVTRSGNTAEIVTECPQLTDDGRRLVARKLLPDTLPMKRVGQKSREVPPPFGGTELDWLFWHKGLAPITDAAFSCIYEDKSELYVPIPGMLVSCRVLMPRTPDAFERWPILCTSETDPGLLLGK
jgi:hypothetical protein